jgi:hypothetical protein
MRSSIRAGALECGWRFRPFSAKSHDHATTVMGCMNFHFLLLGVGVLVPWNAFISAVPYFVGRTCSSSFELWVGMVFNSASVVSLALLLVSPLIRPFLLDLGLGRRRNFEEATTSDHGHSHSFWLVTVPLTLYFAVFVLTDALVAVKNIGSSEFLYVTLFGVVVCGACSSFSQAGIVALSGFFPPQVGINPFVSGQAVGGVAVSAANFLSACAENPQHYRDKYCPTDDSNNNTLGIFLGEENDHNNNSSTCLPYRHFDTAVFLYFFLGAVVLLLCVVGFTIVDRHAHRPHREEYETVGRGHAAVIEQFQDEHSLELQKHQQLATIKTQNHTLDGGPEQTAAEEDGEVTLEVQDGLFQRLPSGNNDGLQSSLELSQETVSVWRAVKGAAFCIFFTFFVTLSLFPAVTATRTSTRRCQSKARLWNDLFTPLTFLLFNCFDLVGRLIAGKIPVARIRSFSTKLVIAALARLILCPLLLLCVGGETSDHIQIQSDAYSLFIQSIFALSNGLLISLAFMEGRTGLPDRPDVQETSSEILTFAVYLGLLSGSLLSFPLSRVVF